jgi:hypothetical protein
VSAGGAAAAPGARVPAPPREASGSRVPAPPRDAPAGARLRTLTRRATRTTREACELCGEPLPDRHRHLLDLPGGELRCCCRACALLFDRDAAGGGHLRLIPEGVRRPGDFAFDDAAWAALEIPVGLAFFRHSTQAGRVVAAYPGPAGATESRLALGAWPEHPALAAMAPDVEALLVNRARGARDDLIVGLDACYRLVGTIRAGWRGLTGGGAVWAQIDQLLAELRKEAR